MALYPFTFRPIFKERIWGGRKLAELYRKELPPHVPIGESWEISDRPGDESLILNGPLAGKSLRWLMANHAQELLGSAPDLAARFPLLVKILDARETLSLQVHPPRNKAVALGGEPKTEMWYVADAEPGSSLYVGLKRGATREQFERKIQDGSVADCFHQIPVARGDAMFLPSGRVHALGAGLVIFEVQQNSDTTYRVFDWNRVGMDGKARELHVAQSLASIDFDDFEPALAGALGEDAGHVSERSLVQHPLFSASILQVSADSRRALSPQTMRILGLGSGECQLVWPGGRLELQTGQFCLVPAAASGVLLVAKEAASCLSVEAGPGERD
jgi:mannose-6-phosphate isomerase